MFHTKQEQDVYLRRIESMLITNSTTWLFLGCFVLSLNLNRKKNPKNTKTFEYENKKSKSCGNVLKDN